MTNQTRPTVPQKSDTSLDDVEAKLAEHIRSERIDFIPPLAPPRVHPSLDEVAAAVNARRTRHDVASELTRGSASPTSHEHRDFAGSFGAAGSREAARSQAVPAALHAREIAARISNTADRLRGVRSVTASLASALAGPVPPNDESRKVDAPETIFAIYAQALDEIDRIIDNIITEQGRMSAVIID